VARPLRIAEQRDLRGIGCPVLSGTVREPGGARPGRGAQSQRHREANMRALLYIAILLVVLWVVARVVGFVAGAMLNILWIVALVLFAIWIFGMLTGRTRV
jgi:hypothetical protein